MTIANRLALLIASAVLGLLLVAGLGAYQLEKVYSAASVNTVNGMPSLLSLGDAQGTLSYIRLLVWRHITQPDPAKKTEIEGQLEANHAKLVEALNRYEKSNLSDDKDRALLAADRAALSEYDALREKLVALSRANRFEEARDQQIANAAIAEKVYAALEAHRQYNNELGHHADKAAQSTKSTALALAFGIAMATLLVVCTLGLFTYRQISRSLRNAQQTIAAIGSSLDFTLRADINGRDEISQTLNAFNHLIDRLQSSLRALQEGVGEVSQTSAELLGASQQVAQSSSVQSESSSHMAASVEQMTVSINHVAERASEASQLSSTAGSNAQNGQQVIGQTVGDIHAIASAVEAAAHDIHELESRSKEIATVVNVIRDVAEQTNLLALNAAIEAARAGETGRGFAVVADEVRKLAERTSSSTQEISDIIHAIQAASGNAVDRMQNAVRRVEQGVAGASSAQQSMATIFDSSSQSVHLVSEISDAIREQGGATNSIALQVEKVAQMAEENSSAASQAAAMAERLEEVAGNMHKVVSAYRL